MAEQDDITPETPVTPEVTPEKDPLQMVPKEKLDDALEVVRQTKLTLEALATDNRRRQEDEARSNVPLPTTQADLLKMLAGEVSVSEQDIRPYLHIIERVMEQRAQPLLQMMNGLAEQLSGVQAHQTYPDYKDFSGDVTKEREESQRRGRWISHEEAYNVVKGRKLPELLQAERDRLTREAAGEGSPGSDLGTLTKAGPSPEKSTTLPSHDELTNMTPEDRQKLIENMTF